MIACIIAFVNKRIPVKAFPGVGLKRNKKGCSVPFRRLEAIWETACHLSSVTTDQTMQYLKNTISEEL